MCEDDGVFGLVGSIEEEGHAAPFPWLEVTAMSARIQVDAEIELVTATRRLLRGCLIVTCAVSQLRMFWNDVVRLVICTVPTAIIRVGLAETG